MLIIDFNDGVTYHKSVADFNSRQNYVATLNKCKKSHKKFTDHHFKLDIPKIKESLPKLAVLGNEIKQHRMRDKYKTIAVNNSGEKCMRIDELCYPYRNIRQGYVGDCWLIASFILLFTNYDLFGKVIPDNNLSKDSFRHGIYNFNLYVDGKWQNVVIDDKLLFFDNNLIFGHNTKPNEFWLPLIEKAFAKVFGGYEKLHAGNPEVAMIMLTGGGVPFALKTESYKLSSKKEQFWTTLINAYDNKILISCSSTDSCTKVNEEIICHMHEYAVIGVYEFDFENQLRRILKIFNPHNNNLGIHRHLIDFNLESLPTNIKTLIDHKNIANEQIVNFDEFIDYFTEIEIFDPRPLRKKSKRNTEISNAEMINKAQGTAQVSDPADSSDSVGILSAILKRWLVMKFDDVLPTKNYSSSINFSIDKTQWVNFTVQRKKLGNEMDKLDEIVVYIKKISNSKITPSANKKYVISNFRYVAKYPAVVTKQLNPGDYSIIISQKQNKYMEYALWIYY